MKLESLGQNIDRIRQARGWSKGELSKRVNVAFSDLGQHIRTGRMSLETLCRYAEALGCTVGDLTDGVVDPEDFTLEADITSYYPWNLSCAVGECKPGTDEARDIMYRIYVPALNESLKTLTEREQRVLALRYVHGKTLEQAGNALGVTRERIRQIEAKALRKLRHPRNWKHWQFDTMDKVLEAKAEASGLALENITLKRRLSELEPEAPVPEPEEPAPDMPIDNLELSVRSYNCLCRVGIRTLNDLRGESQEQLMKVRNLGRKSLDEIVAKAKEWGVEIE